MMSCVCVTTALRLFIRDVAQLQLKPVAANSITSIQSSKRKFSALHTQQLRCTPRLNYEGNAAKEDAAGLNIIRTTATGVRALTRPRPANRLYASERQNALRSTNGLKSARSSTIPYTSFERSGRRVYSPRATRQRSDTRSSVERRRTEIPVTEPQYEPAILEITPETIASLAEKSSRTEAQRLAKPVVRRPPSSKEFGLHFSAPPLPDTERLKLKKPLPKYKAAALTRKGAAETAFVRPQREHWQTQKAALKEKFPEGWAPLKKLSPDALDGIRALNAQFPEQYTTTILAQKFEVTPEAIRRILKSKWKASEEEEADRKQRWFNRGKSVWERYSEQGMKPPKKWRTEGIGNKGAEILANRQRQREWAHARPRGKQLDNAPRDRGGNHDYDYGKKPVTWTTSRPEDVATTV